MEISPFTVDKGGIPQRGLPMQRRLCYYGECIRHSSRNNDKTDMATKATKKTIKKAARRGRPPGSGNLTKKGVRRGRPSGSGKFPKRIYNPKVKIDEEFESLLTPLTAEEYKRLEEGICRDELREPLLVWEGKGILVDGHNRLKICKENGKDYFAIEKSFANRDEVKLWIWDNQEGRRNMSPFRRVEVVLQLKDIIAEQAKKKQRAGGGNKRAGGAGCPKLDKATDKPVHTDKILARKAGVSKGTFRNAESVVKKIHKGKVSEKDIAALRKGEAKINTMYKRYCVDQSNASKTTQQSSQEIEGRLDRSLSTIERRFSKIEDRNSLYDKIIEWANARKAGVEEPSE
jgi:ParB-like chromosome segregation protein Spo0J